VCYTARVLKAQQKLQLERELEMISYSCGCCFQDMEDREEGSIFDLVFVNDKLTCSSPIEAPYYVVFTDLLCFYCGSEQDLRNTGGYYPICEECCTQGKVAKQKNSRAFKPTEQAAEED